MNSGEPFVICDNLVKIYRVAGIEIVALQGLDLVIQEGELIGIVGASGSGKSTLMNILGGLDKPTAGRLWVGGKNLLDLSDIALTRYRRNEVGFVWQQGARNLIPYLTAQENIELPMALAGKPGNIIHERASVLLEAVGLLDRRSHHMQMLSGGEQQRVAIAVSLANEPSLLLADEPTGELDTTSAEMIYAAFQNINQQFGVTTLIVSHDPNITRHVQRVVQIRDGKTASETVRVENNFGKFIQTDDMKKADQRQEEYLELVVLDSAGRLQLPKEYLEKYRILKRVQLEYHEEGILIKAAPSSYHEHIDKHYPPDKFLSEERHGGWKSLLGLRSWMGKRGEK